jgi:hypothetical protein
MMLIGRRKAMSRFAPRETSTQFVNRWQCDCELNSSSSGERLRWNVQDSAEPPRDKLLEKTPSPFFAANEGKPMPPDELPGPVSRDCIPGSWNWLHRRQSQAATLGPSTDFCNIHVPRPDVAP